MINKGTYRAVVDGPAQFGKAETGTDQVVLPFRITEEGDERGSCISWFGYFTERTWERTMQALRYCGWKGEDVTNLGTLDQEVEIVVDHETDQKGTLRAKVQWVNRLGGGRVQLKKPMTADELRAFGAIMKSKARQVAEVRTEPAASKAPSNGGGIGRGGDGPPPQQDEDDLPF